MLTATIIYNGNESRFLSTANLFFSQKLSGVTQNKVDNFLQLIVLDKTGVAANNEKILTFFRKHGNAVVYIDASSVSLAQASNIAVDKANGLYMVFLSSGDTFSAATLNLMVDFYRKNHEKFNFVFPNIRYYSRVEKRYIAHFPIDAPETVLLAKRAELTPLIFSGVMFKTKTLKLYRFSENATYDYGLNLIYRLLAKTPEFAIVKNATFDAIDSLESENISFNHAMDKEWYWGCFQQFLLPLYYSYTVNGKNIPRYLQFAALYQLKWLFQLNVNNATKRVIDDCVDEFFDLCSCVLKHMDPEVLLTVNKKFALSLGLKDLFFRLKHGLKESNKYQPNYFTFSGNSYLEHEGRTFYKINSIQISLDLLEFDSQFLIIESSIENYIDFTRCKLKSYFDNEPIEIEETYRYAHMKYFGKSVHKRHTFKVKIPKAFLNGSLKLISFVIELPNGVEITPCINTKRYTAHLSSSFPGSYWISHGYLVRFTNNKKSIKIIKSSAFNSLKAELIYMKNMAFGKKKNLEMFKLRCYYWLSYFYFKNKRIWLTYDKLYKAGDCGEYFYKYAISRNEKAIKPAYLVNKNTADYRRLRKEGFSPLARGTLKQRLYFLYSEVIFTTHTAVCGFNAFNDDQIIYFQNVVKFDVACIQHGLTMQGLAFDCNRLHNNIKRYYCASKYEVGNLARPIYGYEDKEILRLTGIPRFDGLINASKKQILIAPTWRNYIAMPPVMGSVRPYNANFKNTKYFNIYNRLLSDERLIQAVQECGYKLIYLLHPIVSAQENDYQVSPEVEIVSALNANFEKMLTESSLMVTDYSGVQYDFAYMRKPVIYYHPDELPPHYKDGGFIYDTMGFGEICKSHDGVVDMICDYMRRNCTLQPLYAGRQDDFFEFDDLNNCQRIYDDMLEYQKNRHLKIRTTKNNKGAYE